MKNTRFISIIVASFFSLSWASADPNIAGVSGVISQGQTISITGSDFGSKSTAAPIIWDDVESGSFNGNWSSTYDLSVNTNNQRHTHSTRNGHLNFRSGDTDARVTASNDTHAKWFVQYWFKLGNNWDWGSTDFSGNNRFLSNIKVFRMWNPGAINENFVVAINGWVNQMEYVVENVASNDGGTFFTGLKTKMSKGTWHLFQFEYSENSSVNANDGVFRAWFNGELVIEDTSLKTREDFSQLKRPFIIGFSEVWGPSGGESDDAPNDFYIDEIYMDNAWARVEIGDNPVYANCTHREVLIPSSWSSNLIQASVQAGSFSNGTLVYLYVVDNGGVVNSAGFPLMMGQAADDPIVMITDPTTDPNFTVGVGDSTFSIGGTGTDDVSISNITWLSDQGASGNATNTSGNWSTWSISNIPLQFGNNVITVTATDGDGNTGQDQITLNRPSSSGNLPPTVNAGLDLSVFPSVFINLNGTTSDDGLPNPPGTVSVSWSLVSGPGAVQFFNPTAAQTTALFPLPGDYVLRLSGTDGEFTVHDEARITVKPTSALDLGRHKTMVRPSRNENAEILYNITQASTVEATLYQRSRKVRVIETTFRNPGQYVVQWDGRDQSGKLLPSGLYWIVINIEGQFERHKVVLIK